jgi:uncharacterized alpha/beta hydrolase family protein
MLFRILLVTFAFVTLSTTAQRTLPNPIILVHGWSGSSSTWDKFSNYLDTQPQLTVDRNSLNFNLNCDYNRYTSNLNADVCDNSSSFMQNQDVYVVNFDSPSTSFSSQAGTVKQGYALKLAIRRVLAVSGADKVVLLGHSMGGLAIREYLQTKSNWQPDGQHHVAKIITMGTPHGGSNSTGWNIGSFLGFDENSEAVRDLRTDYTYSNCTRNGSSIRCPGVYLFGGVESSDWMRTNFLGGSNYYNLDVDCNGGTGGRVLGLNQKSISSDLDFACIIGGPSFSDFVVTVESQNLNNYYSGLNAELYYYDCGFDPRCHSNQPRNAFSQMMQALDEPKEYLTELKLGTINRGLFNTQPNGSTNDRDDYLVFLPQRGVFSYNASNVVASNGIIMIVQNSSGRTISSESIQNGENKSFVVESGGYYRMRINGSALNGWATYSISTNFCNLPEEPQISSDNGTTICEGEKIELKAISGYDEYRWYRDEVKLPEGTNTISASGAGNFRVDGVKCGVISNSVNSITTAVQPKPEKPVVVQDIQPDKLTLTSSSSENNQWLLNGKVINGATEQDYIPTEYGNYTVQFTSDGCSSLSEVTSVTVEKPKLTYLDSANICEGDSVALVAPPGFGEYIFQIGQREIVSGKTRFLYQKAGNIGLQQSGGY